MRHPLPAALALTLALAACSKGPSQADALDNAANQADPAAADVMRNEADAIRANGSETGDLAAPGSPVQDSMSNAGAAAAAGETPPVSSQAKAAPPATQAKPRRAGDTVPPPQVR